MNKLFNVITRSLMPIVLAFTGQSFAATLPHNHQNSESTDGLRINTLKNSLEFFNRYAYNKELNTYYSEIANDGAVVSTRIHTVALSRLIYSLAYSAKYFPENIQKAKDSANYLLNNLVVSDNIGPYFIPSIANGVAETNDVLDIWQQAYGLTGLTELYRNTGDANLLKQIHGLHDAFVRRFHDRQYGGFYNNYSLSSGQQTAEKSIQSLIYPISAYMGNLWLSDTRNRAKYQPFLQENLQIIMRHHIWSEENGWINAKFNRQWKPCEQKEQDEICFSVSPGHNFQLAWFLLRSHEWNFLPKEDRQYYRQLGEHIIDITLAKPVWDKKNGGFFENVNPTDDAVLSEKKSWWQHSEALIALSYDTDRHSGELATLERFYFEHFIDYKIGGEFFYIDKNNQPIMDELKGSKGKSSYHITEAIRYLLEHDTSKK